MYDTKPVPHLARRGKRWKLSFDMYFDLATTKNNKK